MPILAVRHVTTYRYRQPVSFGEHRMMLRPREGHDQQLLAAALTITPEPLDVRWLHDVFGNTVAIARFGRRARELRFESVLRLLHRPVNALDFPIEEYATSYPFSYAVEEMPDLSRTIERHAPDPEHAVDHWARQFLRNEGRLTDTRDLLTSMTHAIRRDFTYVAREEMGVQSPTRTLWLRSGSCRDFAMLMIEAVRALGLAARFVSGYLHVPKREGAPAHLGGGATHAWAQVYLPGAGWVEFDPTNGIVGNRDLIRVAVARDPRQAVPLHGTWIGFPADNLGMTVEVDVTAEPEAPASPATADAPKRQVPADRPVATAAAPQEAGPAAVAAATLPAASPASPLAATEGAP
ncbi:transglutaminase family protein [Roseomonas sp. NAR14]|uniref:Transglutaminase family protein n=1 Tax=Roseomonas acroporae TaxID=2937791 RepID=A0A9X1Y7S3_9PROT|nr:transglutaminase family protein [Roseomonas acroporae]MCK8784657.1 transglutaminase family protein [Roseomonas acroporae]